MPVISFSESIFQEKMYICAQRSLKVMSNVFPHLYFKIPPHPPPKKKFSIIGLDYFCVTYKIFLISLRDYHVLYHYFTKYLLCNYSFQDDSLCIRGRKKYKNDQNRSRFQGTWNLGVEIGRDRLKIGKEGNIDKERSQSWNVHNRIEFTFIKKKT